MTFAGLNDYLSDCINEKVIPGCVCWVGDSGKTHFFERYGHAQITPQALEMQKDTIFDLASITKPMVTALSIMILYERGVIDLNDPVMKYLPSLGNSATARATVKQLMTHTSGLHVWYPTYLFPADTRLERIADQNTGEKKVAYSCLGYLLLGKIIEIVTNVSLARFFMENIGTGLSANKLHFGPLKETEQAAATECGNVHEKQMASQYGLVSQIQWRTAVIRGQVHDGNAYYAFDNVAGNAGLFSSAWDLATLTRAYLRGEIVSKKTLDMMARDHTGGEEKRGLGWKMDMFPGLLSPASFGHTGFTGTMLVVDPQHDLIIILLANAVHPKVQLGLMNPIRREAIRMISETLRIN